MFKHLQKETNRYATQQINKKKQEGFLKPKSVFAQWNTASLEEIKKLFSVIIHMSVLRKSSVRDYWSLRPIIHTPYAASVGMSRDRFLALLTMLHLNNNDAKAARGYFVISYHISCINTFFFQFKGHQGHAFSYCDDSLAHNKLHFPSNS